MQPLSLLACFKGHSTCGGSNSKGKLIERELSHALLNSSMYGHTLNSAEVLASLADW
jgi:hypothetical protein